MIVTQIAERGRSRCAIYLDGDEAFVLYKSELRSFQIREGEELSQVDYDRILSELLPKRARLRAMNLLKSREYTTEQLRRKLDQGGYPEPVIRDALDYVASFHYTDDLRYAEDYIASHADRRSRMRIAQDLQGKGISRDTLERAWAAWEEQGGAQDERAMIAALMEKRRYDPETADAKERRRMYAFLMQKGFSAEQVGRAMRVQG